MDTKVQPVKMASKIFELTPQKNCGDNSEKYYWHNATLLRLPSLRFNFVGGSWD
jgi:hypothetical protein